MTLRQIESARRRSRATEWDRPGDRVTGRQEIANRDRGSLRGTSTSAHSLQRAVFPRRESTYRKGDHLLVRNSSQTISTPVDHDYCRRLYRNTSNGRDDSILLPRFPVFYCSSCPRSPENRRLLGCPSFRRRIAGSTGVARSPRKRLRRVVIHRLLTHFPRLGHFQAASLIVQQTSSCRRPWQAALLGRTLSWRLAQSAGAIWRHPCLVSRSVSTSISRVDATAVLDTRRRYCAIRGYIVLRVPSAPQRDSPPTSRPASTSATTHARRELRNISQRHNPRAVTIDHRVIIHAGSVALEPMGLAIAGWSKAGQNSPSSAPLSSRLC